ncbi:MAG: flagella basal body P-ring formation protein FlgA [Pseudomonadota bacterium]|nr:flagella basal body P-ring formation protein FlgA [Pseudomonadota bacterium]
MFSTLFALLPAVVAGARAGTVEDAVRDTVAAHLEVPPEDVDVQGVGALAGLPEDAACSVQLPQVGSVEGIIQVVLYCGDEVSGEQRHLTRAVVQVWRTVPVAAWSVEAGERVETTMERVSGHRLRGEIPVEAGGAYRARVDLAAGEPLTMSRAAPWPDAPRGADVLLVAGSEGGGLVVTANGQLLQDGWVDKRVGVLNLATRAVLQGTFRSDGTVVLGSAVGTSVVEE